MARSVGSSHPGAAGSVAAAPRRPFERVLSDERVSSVLVYAISIALVLMLWEIWARLFGFLALFPPPSITLKRLAELLMDGTLERAALVSLARILGGFVLGSLAGVLLGLLMGSSLVVRAVAEPYVHFLRFVPPLAWFAPILLWFGTGESTRILLIMYTTIFVVALNTMAGVAAIAPQKLRMARAFGASHVQLFFLVVLPACAPFIFTGMRMAMGNSFMTVVAAEMLGATDGLGYMIVSSQFWLDMGAIFAAVIVIGVLGFATDRVFRALIARFGAKYDVSQSAFK